MVMTLNSFTEQPFCDLPECFAGWMARQAPASGEIYEPKTVVDKVDVTSNTRICAPVIIDLERGEAIWADVAVTNHAIYQNNVAANLTGLSLMPRAMTDLRKTALYTLFDLHIRAPGAPAILGQESVVGGNALALPPAELTPFASTRIVAIGRALSAYPAVAARLAGWCAASFDGALPRAADLLALASQQFAAGCAVSAELALPVYVRDDVVRAPVTPMQ